MIRILQLIDVNADFESRRSATALAARLGDGFDVERRSIGPGGDFRNLLSAIPALRRMGARFDVIHAFGTKPQAAAIASALPVVLSMPPEIRPSNVRWLRAAMGSRRIEVIAPTSTIRRILVERGVPIKQTHLIRPGVDFSMVRIRRDVELRARLGFSPDDRVLLAVGESTRSAAHRLAVWVCSILNVVDPRFRLLIWGRGPMAKSAANFAARLQCPDMIVTAEAKLDRKVEFEELLPVADAAIVSASGAVSTLPIATCMAAGLPIVSTVTYTNGELLEDRHTALLTPKNVPRAMAQRVTDLFEDGRLRWSISDTARTEAFEYFSVTRFVNQFRTVFRQIKENQSVEVPEVAAGAGSRFHGRGG